MPKGSRRGAWRAFNSCAAAIEDYGLAGFVMNGAYRDIEDAQRAGFPLYGAGVAAWSGPKAGPFEINVPVCCGSVIVQPGDVVSASTEGAVIVPRAYAGQVKTRRGWPSYSRPENRSADKDGEVRAVTDFIRKVDAHIDHVFEQGEGVYLDADA